MPEMGHYRAETPTLNFCVPDSATRRRMWRHTRDPALGTMSETEPRTILRVRSAHKCVPDVVTSSSCSRGDRKNEKTNGVHGHPDETRHSNEKGKVVGPESHLLDGCFSPCGGCNRVHEFISVGLSLGEFCLRTAVRNRQDNNPANLAAKAAESARPGHHVLCHSGDNTL